MVELVDTTDLKFVGHSARAGSSPAEGTNKRNMNKNYIPELSRSIRNNAKYLRSVYITLADYRYKIYKLYARKRAFEYDWEEDLFFETELHELNKRYTSFKEYVKKLDKEQK